MHACLIVCHMQTGGKTVVLTADGKTKAQRAFSQDNTDDQVKAFTPVDQPLRDQYAAREASGQARDSLRPVRTIMPAGSGPLPTPHAVPHQSPPAQTAQANAVVSNMHGASQELQSPSMHTDDIISDAASAPLMGGSPQAPQGTAPARTRPQPGRTVPQ